jgi:uncharacterized protein with von Willebrand factor type A (vWA) domain
MNKWTDTEKKTIHDMAENGKAGAEIVDFVKKNYQKDISLGMVSYIRYNYGKKKAPAEKKTKPSGKEKCAVRDADLQKDDVHALIDRLFDELNAYSAFVIRRIRKELVNRIAEARKKRIDAGESVAPIDEKEFIDDNVKENDGK